MKQDGDKLSKIIALTDSSHDGEALAAFRAAWRILRREGWHHHAALVEAKPQPVKPIEQNVQACLEHQVSGWRNQALHWEKKANEVKAEAERWRRLAEETADKLWDLSQALGREGIQADEFLAASLTSRQGLIADELEKLPVAAE